jgi:Tfp pilus assembly protein PilN
MAIKINLLPTDQGATGSAAKIVKTLNKITLALGIMFLVFGVIGGGILVYQSIQVRNLTARQDQLENSIKSLETTEQKLFLVKDRTDKIKTILTSKNAYDNAVKLSKIVNTLPPEVTLDDVDIDVALVHFSVISKSSLGMVNFVSSLISSGAFTQVTLKNFSYTQNTGYQITLEAF